MTLSFHPFISLPFVKRFQIKNSLSISNLSLHFYLYTYFLKVKVICNHASVFEDYKHSPRYCCAVHKYEHTSIFVSATELWP